MIIVVIRIVLIVLASGQHTDPLKSAAQCTFDGWSAVEREFNFLTSTIYNLEEKLLQQENKTQTELQKLREQLQQLTERLRSQENSARNEIEKLEERLQNMTVRCIPHTSDVQGASSSYKLPLFGADTFEWTRFGKNLTVPWNYINNHDPLHRVFEFLTDADLIAIKDLNFEDFYIESDVSLAFQADDSTNPSQLRVWYPHLRQDLGISIGYGRDNTQLILQSHQRRLLCKGSSSSNSCGTRQMPLRNQQTNPFFLASATMDPQGSGASAHQNQWQRNKYTVTGSFYYVWIKIKAC